MNDAIPCGCEGAIRCRPTLVSRTTMAPAYQPLPTTEKSRELKYSNEDHIEDQLHVDSKALNKRKLQTIHLAFIGLFVFYMSFSITTALLPKGNLSGARSKCHQGVQRLKCMVQGQHCNMHSGSVKALPTSFTLPSGDKIPSVALGMVER